MLLKSHARSCALPQAEFVPIRIVEKRQQAASFLLDLTGIHSTCLQLANGLANIVRAEAQAGITGGGNYSAGSMRHQLEEYAVNVEPCHIITRDQGKPQLVVVEGNRFFQVIDVVENGIEFELQAQVRIDIGLRHRWPILLAYCSSRPECPSRC